MHPRRKFAIIYCTIMAIIVLVTGKISCDSFVGYMGWTSLFSSQREVIK
jgi:hypothetical protein